MYRFRHYKGGVYELLDDNVIHSETGELMVYYRQAYAEKPKSFVRPKTMFYSKVVVDGIEMNRFTLIP